MDVLVLLLLMILCHIIDDFVLQPVCLSNLKQKSWWENNVLNKSSSYRKLYKYDYIMALVIHSLSWSIMISLPFIFMTSLSGGFIFISVLINTIIHFIVDNLKANLGKINLITDQIIHLCQILITFLLGVFLL